MLDVPLDGCRVTLKRHTDTVFHTQHIQTLDNLFTKECAVHTQLKFCPEASVLNHFYTIANEALCPIAIVHVSAATMHSKHLGRLRHGAIEWIVTTLAFFLLVKSFGRTLGMPTGAQHRSIKVQCNQRQCLACQCFNN